ncbi:MAG TPA: hypothetical protein VND65_19670 [Candidatus Binatia bacterium]|nr:hypothetical protein [Candidatus Binatia bacterium]
MDPNAIIQLALAGLNAIVGVIAEIKSQHGMTDDQIAAEVQKITGDNDLTYQQMIAALGLKPTPPAAPATTPAAG